MHSPFSLTRLWPAGLASPDNAILLHPASLMLLALRCGAGVGEDAIFVTVIEPKRDANSAGTLWVRPRAHGGQGLHGLDGGQGAINKQG